MSEYTKKRTRTKQAIIDGLMSMANQKGFENVTVSDIIKTAQINRSTFYNHFVNINDLIEYVESGVLDEIKRNYEERSRDHFAHGEDWLWILLGIIEEHHRSLAFLLGPPWRCKLWSTAG